MKKVLAIFLLWMTVQVFATDSQSTIYVDSFSKISSVVDKKKLLYLEGYYSTRDGGEGYFRWNEKVGKSRADGGITIDPTQSFINQGKGKGYGCWVRQYSGNIKTEWFGIKSDGSNATIAFSYLIKYLRVNGGGTVLLPSKTIATGNLDFTACSNTTIIGQGKLSVIDFKYANQGIGLNFGSTEGIGGTKNIILSNFTLTNSQTKIDALLEFRSGPTRRNPVETSGFITLKNLFFEKGATKALSLVGISHLLAEGLVVRFNTPIDYGLYISQDVNINTGIYTFRNCSFRAKKTALVIEASKQLIDTILFEGCGFFNYLNSLAREVIILNGKNYAIESVKFLACHIESRNTNPIKKTAIAFKGKLHSINFDTIHLSCGKSNIQTQADYAFKFHNRGNYKNILFNNVSILRCKKASAEGVVYYFEGQDSSFEKESPIQFRGLIRSVTKPKKIKFDNPSYQQYLMLKY